jgi:hypothetical protein
MGWEGCWGDDRRGPDRPDTSRLFRATTADQGDRTDTIGEVAGKGLARRDEIYPLIASLLRAERTHRQARSISYRI